MKPVKYQIRSQIWNTMLEQVEDQVRRDHRWDQVKSQVVMPVWDLVEQLGIETLHLLSEEFS